MSKMIIVEGNSNDKDNVRVIMVKGERGYGIASIEKTETVGLTDTYTITFDDGTTTTFDVTNGEMTKETTVNVYDTVADMVADTTIRVDTTCKTLGYYSVNDGGGSEYVIVNDNTLTDDGGSIHTLENGLKAKLIIKDSVNVKQFGAKGNGTNDDTQLIQNALDFVQNSYTTGHSFSLIFPTGKYIITETLNLSYYTRIKSAGFVRFQIPSNITNITIFAINEIAKLTSSYFAGAGIFDAPIIDGSNGGIVINGNSNKGTGSLIGIKMGDIVGTPSTSEPLHGLAIKNVSFHNLTTCLLLIPNNLFCNNFENLTFYNSGIGVQYSTQSVESVNSGERINFDNCTFGNVAESIHLYVHVALKFTNCSFDFCGCVGVNDSNMGRLEFYNCWIERNARLFLYRLS